MNCDHCKQELETKQIFNLNLCIVCTRDYWKEEDVLPEFQLKWLGIKQIAKQTGLTYKEIRNLNLQTRTIQTAFTVWDRTAKKRIPVVKTEYNTENLPSNIKT